MFQPLLDYYRLPARFTDGIAATTDCASGVGFFQFGPATICYGRHRGGVAPNLGGASQFDAAKAVRLSPGAIALPFSFDEVINNLRLERYRQGMVSGRGLFGASTAIRKLYYLFREGLSVKVRRRLQKIYFRDWEDLPFPSWPLDFTVDNLHEEFLRLLMESCGVSKIPFIWFWPEGSSNTLMMTHDVETGAGRDFTAQLMDLDEAFGMKASFQVIPEKRYEVPSEYVRGIRERGFEVNVHDLNHDGNLYRERNEFELRAARINDYLRRFNSRGFRAGAMYRNQDWYDAFEFSYDMSVPNVAHLEPMRGGCCTVMPYFIGKIVELPLTLAQDYSLFHIMDDYSIDLWKQQLTLLRKRYGLMSFITHPDYLIERRARNVYEALLDHLRQIVRKEKIWVACPGEIDAWWRARHDMKLVPRGDGWEIVGPQKERACLAYAILDAQSLRYELARNPSSGNALP